jgi:hypothetical protein
MKKLIRDFLSILFAPLAPRIGYVSRKEIVDKNNLLGNFFDILVRIGFQVDHVVDVGANRGDWTRVSMQYFPNAYYTLVEPQSWLKDSVENLIKQNPKVKFYGVGASDASGLLTFTLPQMEQITYFL